MKGFKCPSCGKTSFAEYWNDMTLSKCQNRQQRRAYVPIENETGKKLWYVCPECAANHWKRHIKIAEFTKEDVNVGELDPETVCEFCIHDSYCDHVGVTGGPNGPIYAPCADNDPETYFDYDAYIKSLEEERK